MSNKIIHSINHRVIYGDTDNMGVVYYANYLRWFEIGRNELMRSIGLPYSEFERQGYIMPVAEVSCKYKSPCIFDEIITIESHLQVPFKVAIIFNHKIFSQDKKELKAEGYTKHAILNTDGKIVRPPKFLKQIIDEKL